MANDSEVLRPLRRGEGLVRGRFETEHDGATYVVDAHYLDLDEHIRLYRNGRLVDTARGRATFHLGGGVRIEAAVAKAGMKYVRLRQGEAGDTVQLPPADRTAEAWRARIGHAHPTASRVVGWISLVVLLAVLGIELPQLVNLGGNLTPLIGLPSFDVPALTLSGWVNLALIFLAGAAGLERSLSMKYNPLLDD